MLVATLCFAAIAPNRNSAQETSAKLGLFANHGDIGTVLHPGSVRYDPSAQTYVITGSGENMWFSTDAFQFVWKKVSGDVSLAADIAFQGSGGNPHRKAVLMIRQSLDPDSVYADVALHGVGLTSLQFRDQNGAATHEIQSNLSAPKRLRIEKRGPYVYLWLAPDGKDLRPAGAAIRVEFQEPFYVGLGVCSHDKNVSETAVFSEVSLETPPSRGSSGVSAGAGSLYSTLESVDVASTDRRVVYGAEAASKRPTGPTMAHRSSSIAAAASNAFRSLAALRRRSTPHSPRIATTITASRRMAGCSRSVMSPGRRG
jgi:TolB protein